MRRRPLHHDGLARRHAPWPGSTRRPATLTPIGDRRPGGQRPRPQPRRTTSSTASTATPRTASCRCRPTATEAGEGTGDRRAGVVGADLRRHLPGQRPLPRPRRQRSGPDATGHGAGYLGRDRRHRQPAGRCGAPSPTRRSATTTSRTSPSTRSTASSTATASCATASCASTRPRARPPAVGPTFDRPGERGQRRSSTRSAACGSTARATPSAPRTRSTGSTTSPRTRPVVVAHGPAVTNSDGASCPFTLGHREDRRRPPSACAGTDGHLPLRGHQRGDRATRPAIERAATVTSADFEDQLPDDGRHPSSPAGPGQPVRWRQELPYGGTDRLRHRDFDVPHGQAERAPSRSTSPYRPPRPRAPW